MNDTQSLAVEFIEAVKTCDEETVHRVLSSDLAAMVAVEVARMCGKARRDAAEADARARRAESFEPQLVKAGEANRRLIKERADLRRRLEVYRGKKAA